MPDRDRLIDDPQIATNIQRLSEETGIPREQYERLLDAPPPPGADPEDWVRALAHRARCHRPWPREALDDLSRRAAETSPPESPAA